MKHILIVTDISLTEDFSLHTANLIGDNADTVFGSTTDHDIVFRLFANEDTIFSKSLEKIEFDDIVYVLEKDKYPRDHIMDRIFALKTNRVLCTAKWSMDDYIMTYDPMVHDLCHERDSYIVTKRT